MTATAESSVEYGIENAPGSLLSTFPIFASKDEALYDLEWVSSLRPAAPRPRLLVRRGGGTWAVAS